MLDLSAYVMTRARGIELIRFWETDGFQQIRGAKFVYQPSEDGERPPTEYTEETTGDDWEQLEFEVVPDYEQDSSNQQDLS